MPEKEDWREVQAAGPRKPRLLWHHGRRLPSVWTLGLRLSTTYTTTTTGSFPNLDAFLVLVSADPGILVQEVESRLVVRLWEQAHKQTQKPALEMGPESHRQ
jgi:hypothetical protein